MPIPRHRRHIDVTVSSTTIDLFNNLRHGTKGPVYSQSEVMQQSICIIIKVTQDCFQS